MSRLDVLSCHPSIPACSRRTFSSTASLSRKTDDSVILVRNEDVIPTATTAVEYLQLYNSAGGKMGGAVSSWTRVGISGVYGLKNLSQTMATETFSRISEKDIAAVDAMEREKLLSALGLLAYACEPSSLRSLLKINLTVALAELEMRAGGEAAARELLTEGMQALLLVCWGAAPEQQGGRAAQREYVDVNVHLSPASDELWSGGDVAVELIPPARKGKMVDRGGGKKAAVRQSFTESLTVAPDGSVSPSGVSTLVARIGTTLQVTPSLVSDPVHALFLSRAQSECGLTLAGSPVSVSDMEQWDEVLLVGSCPLVSPINTIQERGGRVWERREGDQGMIGQQMAVVVREAMLANMEAV